MLTLSEVVIVTYMFCYHLLYECIIQVEIQVAFPKLSLNELCNIKTLFLGYLRFIFRTEYKIHTKSCNNNLTYISDVSAVDAYRENVEINRQTDISGKSDFYLTLSNIFCNKTNIECHWTVFCFFKHF